MKTREKTGLFSYDSASRRSKGQEIRLGLKHARAPAVCDRVRQLRLENGDL